MAEEKKIKDLESHTIYEFYSPRPSQLLKWLRTLLLSDTFYFAPQNYVGYEEPKVVDIPKPERKKALWFFSSRKKEQPIEAAPQSVQVTQEPEPQSDFSYNFSYNPMQSFDDLPPPTEKNKGKKGG